MRVINVPHVLNREFYEEAIRAYLVGAKGYAESVYLAGSIRYPGLSDLDLVVVPKPRYMAPLYLCLSEMIPSRFRAIVQHDPFIVPRAFVPTLRLALLSNLTWLYGEKLLEGVQHDESPVANLCCAIEHLCCLQSFLQHQRSQPTLDATAVNRICNSLRFTLCQLQELGLWEDAAQYGIRMDNLRAQLLETRSEDCVVQLFETFAENLMFAVNRLNRTLKTNVGASAEFAAFYERQEFAVPGLRREEFEDRRRTVCEYLSGLAAQNFWYGTIFNTELYPTFSISRRFRLVAKLVRGFRRLHGSPQAGEVAASDGVKGDSPML